MVPGTWQGRGLRIEYTGPGGEDRSTSGRLLDTCGLGLVLASGGARTVIAWSALTTIELID